MREADSWPVGCQWCPCRRGVEVLPWRDSEDAAGFSANASRSLRIEVDCLRAELKVEF